MLRLRWPTRKRLVISVVVMAFAVVLLAPHGTHGEGCCICGLTRRTKTLAGINYWSATERMSGGEGFYEWYQLHVGVSHSHHWHSISGNTSWLWWGIHFDSMAPAYALYSLVDNRGGWPPEQQKAFVERYASVTSCEDVRRFHLEYHKMDAPNPGMERSRSIDR